MQNVTDDRYERGWQIVAVVERWSDGVAHCTQRGKLVLGEQVEALRPDGETFSFVPEWLRDEEGAPIEATPHAMMPFSLPVPWELPAGSILRRKNER